MEYAGQKAAATKARDFCKRNRIDYNKALLGYAENGTDFLVCESATSASIRVLFVSPGCTYVNAATFTDKPVTFTANGARGLARPRSWRH